MRDSSLVPLNLVELAETIITCRRCPRLVDWREQVARDRRAAYRDQSYWGKPVPGFGDPLARILVVGLAPGAHGANRTGRVFTGDRSGDWLYGSLHRAGLANQANSTHIDDGLTLNGVYVAACVRCVPPGNKPTPAERDTCLPFLAQEIALLTEVRVIVCLGAFAWDGVGRVPGLRQVDDPKGKFGHLAESRMGRFIRLGSYHPSQQNTFTGRLTESMQDDVWRRAIVLAEMGELG